MQFLVVLFLFSLFEWNYTRITISVCVYIYGYIYICVWGKKPSILLSVNFFLASKRRLRLRHLLHCQHDVAKIYVYRIQKKGPVLFHSTAISNRRPRTATTKYKWDERREINRNFFSSSFSALFGIEIRTQKNKYTHTLGVSTKRFRFPVNQNRNNQIDLEFDEIFTFFCTHTICVCTVLNENKRPGGNLSLSFH